ncbi:DUF4062 domain-containing protein [Fusibacter paucivorans]|uniref:DUF4062 domain-containing protein n=1 Tax=Fusibacter paucivorans TaxID=76009 RepID=A0ABS5PSX9_9FIRM|nr:DUF4062 domain-containing protein [Fusibacter paucivorans]MBS7528279.1 DUF4062 domain-containing protein [Fusibacter paucivorans]
MKTFEKMKEIYNLNQILNKVNPEDELRDPNSREMVFFLSSTFEDLEAERNAIKEGILSVETFAEKRGVTLNVVDLRLGVNADFDQEGNQIKNGKVIKACLESIETCAPYFIGLLGNRYGWCPTEEDLSAIDENTFSPFHKAIVQKSISERKSITEIEFMLGVDKRLNPHVLFYLTDDQRYPVDLETFRYELLERTIDQPLSQQEIEQKYKNYLESPQQKVLQESLRNKIHKKYEACCRVFKDTEALKNQLIDDIKKMIEEKYPHELDLLECHKIMTQGYLSKQLKSYIPRRALEMQLNEFYESVKSYAIAIGASGMGKSSVLAKWHYDLLNSDEVDVLGYYVEKNASANLEKYITKILIDLQHRYIRFSSEKIPYERAELIGTFKNWLSRLEGGDMDLVLILDGINQLDDTNFNWLPERLPSNVQIIISIASDNNDKMDKLQRLMIGEQSLIIDVYPMTLEEQEALIKETFMKKYGKPHIREEMLSSVLSVDNQLKSNPLFLSYLLHELVTYSKHDNLMSVINDYTKDSKGSTVINIEDFMIAVFNKRIEIYGKQLIQIVIGLIYVSEYGITMVELMSILKQQFNITLDVIDMDLLLGSIRHFMIEDNGRYKWRHAYTLRTIETILSEKEINNLKRQIILFFIDQPKTNRSVKEVIYQYNTLKDDLGLKSLLSRADVFNVSCKEQYYEMSLGLMMKKNRWDKDILRALSEQENVTDVVRVIRYMNQFGLLNEASDLSKTYEELCAKNYGDQSKEDLVALSAEAYVFEKKGQYDEAIALYEKVAEKEKSTYGEDYPSLWTTWHNLAVCHHSNSQYLSQSEDFSNELKHRLESLKIYKNLLIKQPEKFLKNYKFLLELLISVAEKVATKAEFDFIENEYVAILNEYE